MRGPRSRPATLRRVNLLWYPVALIPIIALGGATLLGGLPILLFPIALFFLFFWLFSFGFAVYAKLQKPKEPRQ